jgi:hypothetical protein
MDILFVLVNTMLAAGQVDLVGQKYFLIWTTF